MQDPNAKLRDEILDQVLGGPAQTEPPLRKAAANGNGLPADLQRLVEKIQAHAYKVTDSDIARLRSSRSDDELFEVIVSAALGASSKRLFAGLRALEDATEEA